MPCRESLEVLIFGVFGRWVAGVSGPKSAISGHLLEQNGDCLFWAAHLRCVQPKFRMLHFNSGISIADSGSISRPLEFIFPSIKGKKGMRDLKLT